GSCVPDSDRVVETIEAAATGTRPGELALVVIDSPVVSPPLWPDSRLVLGAGRTAGGEPDGTDRPPVWLIGNTRGQTKRYGFVVGFDNLAVCGDGSRVENVWANTPGVYVDPTPPDDLFPMLDVGTPDKLQRVAALPGCP